MGKECINNLSIIRCHLTTLSSLPLAVILVIPSGYFALSDILTSESQVRNTEPTTNPNFDFSILHSYTIPLIISSFQ
jgi:hypothetical protein